MRESRFSEKRLEREIEKHVGECEECTPTHACGEQDRIADAFWNAVDMAIDEDREREIFGDDRDEIYGDDWADE